MRYTIGLKLAAGFGLLIVLTIGLALYQERTNGRMLSASETTLEIANLETLFMGARVMVLTYMMREQPESLTQFSKILADLREETAQLQTKLDANGQKVLGRVGEKVTAYETRFGSYAQNVKTGKGIIATLVGHAEAFQESMGKARTLVRSESVRSIEEAASYGDSQYALDFLGLTEFMGSSMEAYLLGRIEMLYFLWKKDPAYLETVHTKLSSLHEVLTTRGAEISDQQIAGAVQTMAQAVAGYRDVSARYLEVMRANAALYEQMVADAAAINEEIKTFVETSEKALESELSETNTFVTVVIFCVVGLGILIAFVSTRAIVKPVKSVTAMAQAVAAGNFSLAANVRTNDELGDMAGAMEEMKSEILQVLETVGWLTGKVVEGRFLSRADENRYQGAFRDLTAQVNTLADALVRYLDAAPITMMSITKDHTINYINKAGLAATGMRFEDVFEKPCRNLFRTQDCGGKGCVCKAAMQTMQIQSSETSGTAKGEQVEIEHFGVPCLDKDGKVVGAFEIILDQTEIKESQRLVMHTAQQAEAIAEQVSSASQELSAQVEQASQGAQEQSGRTGETATAMEQMNATVLEVAQNAGQAKQNAEETQLEARKGAEVVREAVTAILQVRELAEDLERNMETLTGQAEAIGGVMNVINDIADQTNLLALNAAIEAARAGEAGRGFAVVADEVRKLAEKTMAATKEVGDSITSIQSVTAKNREATARASQAVEKTTRLASQSGEALTRIVEMVATTSDQITAIATASEQQSATADEVTRATDDINRISQETTRAMEESARAIMLLARQAADLESLIAGMRG